MKTLHIAAAITVLAGLLMAGCGGAPQGQATLSCATYDVAPPVTLSAVEAGQSEAASELRFNTMKVLVQFYQQPGPGVTVVLTDEQGAQHVLRGEWRRGENQIEAELTGDSMVSSGSIAGVFSSRRVHFEGSLLINSGRGNKYVMPVVGNARDVPADF